MNVPVDLARLVSDVPAVCAAIAAIGALFSSRRNNKQIIALQIQVDGRLTGLLELTERAAKAEGALQGKKEQ